MNIPTRNGKKSFAKWMSKPRGVTITICLIVFLIIIVSSFLLKKESDSYVGTLSLAFTALGALATVATLVVAVELYDRFGLRGHFVHKQTETVLQLVDALKGKHFYFYMKPLEMIVRPGQVSLLYQMPAFHHYANKPIAFDPDDYQSAVDILIAISKSYWLPNEIREQMVFLEIYGAFKLDDGENIDNYVKMNCVTKSKRSEVYLKPLPAFTPAEFCENLRQLCLTIETWLLKHSRMKLDYRFEQSIPEIENDLSQ